MCFKKRHFLNQDVLLFAFGSYAPTFKEVVSTGVPLFRQLITHATSLSMQGKGESNLHASELLPGRSWPVDSLRQPTDQVLSALGRLSVIGNK